MSTAPFDTYARAYRDGQARFHDLTGALSDEQFNWKPEEGRWSVAEVVAHLNTMARGYLPVLEEKLGGELPELGERELRHGWIAQRFVNAVSPGTSPMKARGRLAVPATGTFRSEHNKVHLMADFDGYTDRFVALVERSRGKAIDRVQVVSPFLAVLRLSAAAFLDALGQHTLRHADQADGVRRQPRFPRA